MIEYGIVDIRPMCLKSIEFVLAIVCEEAITNLLTKSEIFMPVRKFLFDRRDSKIFKFLHDLLDCGYCTSVWIGWFIAFLYLNNLLCNIVFIGIALHRLSNLLHHFIDKMWNKEGP